MSMNSALAQILAFFKVYLIAWIKYCMYEILQYIMSRDAAEQWAERLRGRGEASSFIACLAPHSTQPRPKTRKRLEKKHGGWEGACALCLCLLIQRRRG